jgi:hypothetical protein
VILRYWSDGGTELQTQALPDMAQAKQLAEREFQSGWYVEKGNEIGQAQKSEIELAAGSAKLVARVQRALVVHYQHAAEGVGAIALLGLPSEQAAMMRVRVHFEVRNLITTALLEKLFLTVTRMHDRQGDGLPNIFKCLDQADVQSAALSAGGEPHLNAARVKWATIQGDSRFRKLGDYRNQVLAHLVTQEWGSNGGEPVNLFACAHETFSVVEDLQRALGARIGPLEELERRWRARNLEFWSALAGRLPGLGLDLSAT